MKLILSVLFLLLTSSAAFAEHDPACESLLVGKMLKVSNLALQRHLLDPTGKRIFAVRFDALTVADLESGKVEQIITPGNNDYHGAQVSKDGRFAILFGSATKPTLLYDSAANKKIEIAELADVSSLTGQNSEKSSMFSPDGTQFVVTKDRTALLVYDIEKSETKKILLSANLRSSAIFPKSWRLLANLDNGDLAIVDLKSGKQSPFKIPGIDTKSANFQISPDENTLVITVGRATTFDPAHFEMANDYYLYDIAQSKLEKLDINAAAFRALLSPDGTHLAVDATFRAPPGDGKTNEGPYLFNLKTKAKFSVGKAKSFLTGEFSEDGSKYVYWDFTSRGRIVVVDLKNGFAAQETNVDASAYLNQTMFSKDGKRVYTSGTVIAEGGARQVLESNLYCWDLETNTISKFSLPTNLQKFEVVSDGKGVIALSEGAFYIPFTRYRDIAKDVREIPATKEEKLVLYRELFKPGQFTIAADLPVLYDYFSSGLYKENPDWIESALLTTLTKSSLLYEQVISHFPEALQAAWPTQSKLENFPQEVRDSWKQAALVYLNDKISMYDMQKAASIEAWEGLIPLRPFLKTLTEDETKSDVDVIANTLANNGGSRQLQGVYNAKLYKLAKQTVRRFFGVQADKLTDVTVVRDGQKVTPMILGVQPIDGDPATNTGSGVYMRKLSEIAVPQDAKPDAVVLDQTVEWKQGASKFQARIQIKTASRPVAEVLPKIDAPAYNEMWQDGRLTGLVLVGSNMVGDAVLMIDEYIHYYQEQGFKFDADTIVDDTKKFILDAVTNGELDYFIKEAHADGDEKNLTRIYSKSSIKRGEKTLSDGKKEVVYLVTPDKSSSATVLIPNIEFGQAVQAREKAGLGQMVYFNTSCNGLQKAVNETEAAYSPKLIVLGSDSLADTFSDDKGDAEYEMFTAFREGKSFAEMRKAMEQDESYKKGSYDQYVFPDQDKFDQKVRAQLKVPLQIDIKITGPDGKVYNLDNPTEHFDENDPL